MIVIDASVAFKTISSQEEDSDKAKFLFSQHNAGINPIVVPSLLYLEVANALVTKSHVTEEFIKKSLQFLNSLGFTVHSFTKDEYVEAAILAKQYKTSVYDMLYAVVARAKKCNLVTADEQFVKKTKFPFVQLLDTVA